MENLFSERRKIGSYLLRDSLCQHVNLDQESRYDRKISEGPATLNIECLNNYCFDGPRLPGLSKKVFLETLRIGDLQ